VPAAMAEPSPGSAPGAVEGSAPGVVEDGWVHVVGDRIAAVGVGPAPDATEIRLGSLLVTPGFVDVHVHGGAGHQVAGGSPEEVEAEVRRLAAYHATHGTTALLATTVSDTPERLRAAVAGVAAAMRAGSGDGATVMGSHLEGPWLAPGRAGAHAHDQLRPPSVQELASLVEESDGTIRIVTFAPELPGSAELVAAGRAAGITMSVGHTEAGYDTTRAALGHGASHVTHIGNAMPVLDRRRPGPIAAAVADAHATLEVIADGIHVHPGFLAFLAAAAPDRLVAITDATSATGMPDGNYRLGSLDVVVADHHVSLAGDPDTLAGSVLTMDRAVGTLVAAGVDLAAAVRAATSTPAAVLGATNKGQLRAGSDADLVILGPDLLAAATVVAGRVVFDPGGLLAAVSEAPR
jgi:N-acetylglucosamine-6-phosphate deacetylase